MRKSVYYCKVTVEVEFLLLNSLKVAILVYFDVKSHNIWRSFNENDEYHVNTRYKPINIEMC